MNEDRDDPILDVCLEELLGQQAPPDLAARIFQVWSAEQNGGRPGATVPSLGELFGVSVGEPVAPPVQEPVAPPIQLAEDAPALLTESSPPLPAGRESRLTWAAIAIAASMLAMISWLGFNNLRSAGPSVAKRQQVDSPLHDGQEDVAVTPGSSAVDELPAQPVPQRPDPGPAFAQPPLSDGGPRPEAADSQLADAGAAAVDGATPQSTSPATDVQLIAFIGSALSRSWDEHGIQAAPPASDAQWCRRVHLRILGRIPTVDELRSYLADTAPDSRARLVDALLNSDEYVTNWSTMWTNILIGRSGGMRPNSSVDRGGMQQYFRARFRSNAPYDQMAVELITATGATRPGAHDFNGAVNALIGDLEDDATRATNKVAEVFLGNTIQCAQCHNHPFNELDQQRFWELNAFFRQARVVQDGQRGVARLIDADMQVDDDVDMDDAHIYFEEHDGRLSAAYPVYLDGEQIPTSGRIGVVNRREELARLVVGSPHFSRAVVNRMWAHFFGYGFTRSITDMGPPQDPTHPELLDRLATEFAAGGYDLQRLIRWIALSEPFAASSVITPDNEADDPESGAAPLFARYYLRQMRAEEVYQSLIAAADIDVPTESLAQRQQVQGEWMQQFVIADQTDEGREHTIFDGTVHQALTMMNGPLMQQATTARRGNLLHRVAANNRTTPAQKINHLFVAAVGREPTAQEIQAANHLLVLRNGDVVAALEDVWWALLNSNEFILDH